MWLTGNGDWKLWGEGEEGVHGKAPFLDMESKHEKQGTIDEEH